MVEVIRDVSIKIMVDTNKRTLYEEFETITELLAWLHSNGFDELEKTDATS